MAVDAVANLKVIEHNHHLSLETRLEDQYRERDNRDKQIQQIGLQVLRLTFRC